MFAAFSHNSELIYNHLMKDEKEWLDQAAFDLKSAEVLLKGGRYTHCVFFCHLSVEKAIKAAYYQQFKREPPKIHNLNALLKEVNLKPPANLHNLISELSLASVPTRYPEELRTISKEFNKRTTLRILEQSREVVKWIKEQLKK